MSYPWRVMHSLSKQKGDLLVFLTSSSYCYTLPPWPPQYPPPYPNQSDKTCWNRKLIMALVYHSFKTWLARVTRTGIESLSESCKLDKFFPPWNSAIFFWLTGCFEKVSQIPFLGNCHSWKLLGCFGFGNFPKILFGMYWRK